jgi:hypothetical protein
MQVISLVTRDRFFEDYNVTIPTDDFVKVLKSFPSFFKPSPKNSSYTDNMAGNIDWSAILM